ncbi:tail fiber domain-containing protein [Salinisphaera hydrothermalis]|uniref:Peptidase S74 domain-containing protein n=1 Tax=Salinisphaera hydrothermalis (strain C41B8) TaxID=1304275 RepID=A0A084INL2_SALHC|nr:tail fiber domain-containing protein [Salinisphaera hydrothermalis]KEZ78296.1 hypothetical protein C41B8_05323 [Salinisphaera hydrothermalis C41B8]
MGSLFGGGKKTSSQSQSTQLPSWLSGASKKAVNMAENIADRPYQGYSGDRVANATNNEQAGWQVANGITGSYQPYLTQAADALGNANQNLTGADISSYMNPYTQNVTDVAANKMSDQFAQQQNARDENAAQSGAFGGLRSELGDQYANKQYLDAIGNLYTQNMGNAYNSAVNNWQADRANQSALAGQYGNMASNAAGLTSNAANTLMGAGQEQRGINQAQADANYQNFLDQRNWGTNNLNTLLGAVSSVPHGQTTTSTATQGSDPSTGQKIASGIGTVASIAGMFSSKDYKTDKQPVEGSVLAKLASMPVDTWRYKGDSERHVGPYAEDMQEHFGVGNGKQIPIIDAIGTQYAGLKEAAQRIKKLEDKAHA